MRRELQVEFRPGAEPMQQDAEGSLDLPGVEGSYVSTPHVAALGITAELDVRIDVTNARWAGDRQRSDSLGARFAHSPLVAKWVASGNQLSWLLYLVHSGTLALAVSPDGSTIEVLTTDIFTDAVPYVRAGGRTVIRCTYESDVGGTDHRARFFQGFGINGPWLLLSEHTAAGTQALFDATSAPVEIGTFNNGTPDGNSRAQKMTVHQVQVRDGIDGTVVANPVFSGHGDGTSNFIDSVGRDWTVNGDAHISADVPVPSWVTLTAGGPHGNRVTSAEWQIGRERDDEDWPPGEATVELKNHDRLFDPENTDGTYFGLLEPRVPFRLSAPDDTISALNLPEARTVLDLPGSSGDNASCPASSQIAVTGDLDVRVKVAMDDWGSGPDAFCARGSESTDGDYSWRFTTSGDALFFIWSPDSSSNFVESSDVGVDAFPPGEIMWVRVTYRADDGHGNHEVRFWVSQDGADWIEVGTPQTGTGGNRLWGGSQPLTVGTRADGTFPLAGDVHQVEVRDGIGGRVVAGPDFTRIPPDATEFTDGQGNVWTLGGNASVALDTTTRAWADTPDHADFAFAGNMNLWIEASLGDWRPGHDMVLMSKWEETGNQRSWIFALRGDGHLIGVHSTDGTAVTTRVSTEPVTPGPGGRLTVRAFFIPDFFGQSLWSFFTGTDGVNGDLTQLGDNVQIDAAPTTLNVSTAPVEIGTFNSGTSSDPYRQLSGVVHAARIANASDVADPDFTADAAGDPSVTDSFGKVWTLQGDANLIQDPAFVGDQFWGFVQDGWEQTWADPADGYCTVNLVDLFGVLPGEILPSPFEGAIADTGPVAYWRLNEAVGRTGEEVSDQSERQHTGLVIGSPTFGEPALFAGLGDAVLFDKGDQGDQVARVDITRARIGRDPTNETALCIFSTTSRPAVPGTRDLLLADTAGTDFLSPRSAYFSLQVDDLGRIRVAQNQADDSIGPVIDDGQSHIVFGASNVFGTQHGIGVDSTILDDSVTGGTPYFNGIGAAIAGRPNIGAKNDSQFTGTVQHVAVWDRPLTQADRDHIYEHLAGLNRKRSDEQLRWALNRLGVPDDLLELDEGVTTMGVVDSGGKDALDFAREIDATEGGAFFVDHRNGGRLRFRSRYVRWLHHRSRIAQETFSDDPAADAVRVEKGSLVVQPKGISTVVNTWTITWAGGEETATDDASRLRYGPRGDQLDTQAPSSAYARGLARWMLSLTKEPRTLIRGLGLNPAAAHAGFPVAVGLQIWDRTAYRHQPLAKGSVTTRALQIEGAKHQVADGLGWRTDFFVSTAADEHQQLFLADISATDGDHVAAP